MFVVLATAADLFQTNESATMIDDLFFSIVVLDNSGAG